VIEMPEYGNILFETDEKIVFAFQQRMRTKGVVLGFLMLMVVGILIYVYSHGLYTGIRPMGHLERYLFYILLICVSIISILGFIWGLAAFLGAFQNEMLMVYEKGILLPDKTLKNALLRKDEFVLFSRIEAIYPNQNGDVRYITIDMRGDEKAYLLFKADIHDLGELIEVIRDKVTIIDNIDWNS